MDEQDIIQTMESFFKLFEHLKPRDESELLIWKDFFDHDSDNEMKMFEFTYAMIKMHRNKLIQVFWDDEEKIVKFSSYETPS